MWLRIQILLQKIKVAISRKYLKNIIRTIFEEMKLFRRVFKSLHL